MQIAEKLTKVFDMCGNLKKAEVVKNDVSADNLTATVITKLTFKGDCQEKTDQLWFAFHNGKWIVDVNRNAVPRSQKHIGKY